MVSESEESEKESLVVNMILSIYVNIYLTCSPTSKVQPATKKASAPAKTTTAPAPAKKTPCPTVVEVDDDDDDNEVVEVDDDDEIVEIEKPAEEEESSEAELGMLLLLETHSFTYQYTIERLKLKWNKPIYAFYRPEPTIGYENGRRYHEFHCFKKSYTRKVRRYLDTGDAGSTGNLHKHAKKCWGEDTIKAAMDAGSTADDARGVLAKSKDGSISAAFQIKGKGKVTYSHRQHTKAQTRAEIVRWVTENARPFKIVSDRAFKELMKTGRPEYYLPSPTTVARDVRLVFARTRKRIATMLQVSKVFQHRTV